jgi:transglutaminase-like putative cysteine protease
MSALVSSDPIKSNEQSQAGYASAVETEQVFFQEGRLVTGILLAFLFFILALSLDAAGWVEDMSLLMPITIGGVVIGMLMAFSRFDGFFMLTHSFTIGLAWVMYLMSRLVADEEWVRLLVENGFPPLQARAYFLLDRWLTWVQAAVTDSASNDNYVFIFEVSFLIWWLAYLGSWTAFRRGHVWRTVFMASTVLLINTYYAPNSVMVQLVIFCLIAMLLLAWTNLVTQRQRWRAFRIHFSPDIGFDFMRTGLMYTLAVLTIAFVAPSLGRNLKVRELLYPINQRWEETTAEWNRLYQGINRQSRPTAGAFGRTLTLGGERNVGPGAVFQVDAATGRYWRAVTFDTFTGRQWINTASKEAKFAPDQPIENPNWTLREPLTQTVTLLAPTGGVVFAAPDLVQASVPLAGLLSPIGAIQDQTKSEIVELTWARSTQPLEVGDSYTVVSNYADVTEKALREASTDYPPEILERYLQLPDNFSPEVAQLAQEVAGEYSTPFDKARAVEQFLRGYTYDDKISAPAPDQDPVEYFLFDIKRGYCDYYATSMTVMLRSLGIPARTASGYAEGTYDADSGLFIITEQDAHTWVEVFFPGFGWIEFEPTAGESALVRPSGIENKDANDANDPTLTDLLERDRPLLDDGLADENLDLGLNDQQPLGGLAFRSTRSWVIVTILLMLATILLVGWMVWRKPGVFGSAAFDAVPQPIFYRRLQIWTKRLGVVLRADQTPYERASMLEQIVPVGRPFIRQITDSYVRYRFGSRAAVADLAADKTELRRNWEQLRPLLWQVWFRRLLNKLSRNRIA